MTTRIDGVFVTLDHDIREDDVEVLLSAIRLLRGVLDVTVHPVSPESYIADMRARAELRQKLWEVLK